MDGEALSLLSVSDDAMENDLFRLMISWTECKGDNDLGASGDGVVGDEEGGESDDCDVIELHALMSGRGVSCFREYSPPLDFDAANPFTFLTKRPHSFGSFRFSSRGISDGFLTVGRDGVSWGENHNIRKHPNGFLIE